MCECQALLSVSLCSRFAQVVRNALSELGLKGNSLALFTDQELTDLYDNRFQAVQTYTPSNVRRLSEILSPTVFGMVRDRIPGAQWVPAGPSHH
jgi:hypothetical protein